jgi:hypothetical protein
MPSAQVLGMVKIRMRPKPGINGASADFAQPFQFGGEGVRTGSIRKFDVLNRRYNLMQFAILRKRRPR